MNALNRKIVYNLLKLLALSAYVYGLHILLTRFMDWPFYESITVVIIISFSIIAPTTASTIVLKSNSMSLDEAFGLFKSSHKMRSEMAQTLLLGAFIHLLITAGTIAGILFIHNSNLPAGIILLLAVIVGAIFYYLCMVRLAKIIGTNRL